MALTKTDKTFIENALLKQEFKFESKLDDIEQKFEAKFTDFRDNFYTKIDPILKEVPASREERSTLSAQIRRNEERIEKLEKIHPNCSHAGA